MKSAFAISALLLLAATQATAFAASQDAQRTPAVAAADDPQASYADLVDLSDLAGLVAIATIRSAVAVEPERSPGLRPGAVRMYVEADVEGVIRGAAGLPEKIAYLVDLPLDSRGKPPRLKKQRVILFATGAATNGQIRLAAPDAQLVWSDAREHSVREIQRALLSPAAPPIVTGVASAFHVAGSLPGEGETQIFLATANGDPVSLSVLRRPGQPPVWAVAFGEILDESARVPAAGTLGWQRLACGLPPAIPAAGLEGLDPERLRILRADYRLILDQLGSCGRTRNPR